MIKAIQSWFQTKSDKIEGVVSEKWDDITECFENTYDNVSDQAVKFAFKKSIDLSIYLFEHGASSLSFIVNCGPGLSFRLRNTKKRLKILKKWQKKPPFDNKTVLAFLSSLKVETVEISFSTGFQVGLKISMGTKARIRLDILKKNWSKIFP